MGRIRTIRGELTGDRLLAWVRAIARNVVADYFRARDNRREGEPVGGQQPELAQIADARGQALDSSQVPVGPARILLRAMNMVRASVEPRTWEAFSAVAVDRRDIGEVAAQLGVTPDAVRHAVHRVNRLLIRYAKRLAELSDE